MSERPTLSADKPSNPPLPEDEEEQYPTPGGARPRAMVRELGSEEVVTRPSRRRSRRGPEFSFARTAPNWITSAYWRSNSTATIEELTAELVVPSPPTSGSNQVIYIFMGLQNYPVSMIVQPVLQWNLPDVAPGRWSISSWYVETGGEAKFTPPVSVDPGDLLKAFIRVTNAQSGRFDYLCGFEGHPGSHSSMTGLTKLSLAVGVLEAYRIERCANYPANSPITFRNVAIRTPGGLASPDWQVENRIIDCGQRTTFAVAQGRSTISLHCR
jgi:hypothetical protein